MSKERKKPSNFFASWKKLLAYSKSYWPVLVIAVILAAGGNLMTVIAPSFLAQMTDVISAGIGGRIDMARIRDLGLILLALYFFSGLFTLVQGWMMATVTQTISKNLRSDISSKITRLAMAYFSKTSVGDTLSRVTNDVDTIGRALNMSVQNFLSSLTMLIGTLFMMITTSGIMTLTAVGATLIGLVLMGLIMRTSQPYFVQQQASLGSINGLIEETYSGHTVVKVYNAEDKIRQDFVQRNQGLRDSSFKAQALSSLMMPLMGFIGNFGYVAVAVVGASLTMQGRITFGVVVAFTMYVRYFTQPLSQIAQAVQSLQSAAAASERVFEMLDASEMADESHKNQRIENPKGYVEFEGVKFAYGTGDKVIHDFSAQADPGQKIAIVGHTGSGKTTMMNLLMRFYEMDEGDIRIDGISIHDIPRDNLRDQFAMVLQDSWIFEGSIRDNLIYNSQGVSDATMVEASKAVGLDYFINTLPKGYDTYLDEKVTLSQGQRQQLAIARAIIADKPMVILDEATSSVDTRTELKIQSAMDLLMEGRTTFVIAHRLSTIRNADNIIVMADGEILESGKHEDLMAQNGYYTDLYNSQFDKAV